MNKIIKLDIWSDVACPWCYIGKRKLEAAIRQFHVKHQEVEFEVVYRTYFLNPDMPVDFEGGQREYLAQHKGLDLNTVENMNQRLTQIASSVGLKFDLENQIMTNTALAHLALHHAKAHGKQVEMKERLLSAHFVEAKHIGQLEVLVALGQEIGLSPEDLRESLTNGEYLEDVAADLQQAQDYSISGVPFFVIQNRFGVSGAQDSEVFIGAFEKVFESFLTGD